MYGGNYGRKTIRTESEVMKHHFESLSRTRKANKMEDRRHAMKLEDELAMQTNYELMTMNRERRRIQRDLEALKRRSTKDSSIRQIRRLSMDQERLRTSRPATEQPRRGNNSEPLQPTPFAPATKTAEERTTDFLIASGLLIKKEKMGNKSLKNKQQIVVERPSDARKLLSHETPEGEIETWLRSDEEVAIDKDDSTVLPQWEMEQLEADGRPRTRFIMPPFDERMKEARKARYVRSSEKNFVERERELSLNEIFDKK